MSPRVLKMVVPIIVLLAGVAAAALIASARKAPPRQESPPQGPLVEVMTASAADIPVAVSGHGEVVAKVAVDIVPQVGGKVVSVSQSLVAGGFFEAGETTSSLSSAPGRRLLGRASICSARRLKPRWRGRSGMSCILARSRLQGWLCASRRSGRLEPSSRLPGQTSR